MAEGRTSFTADDYLNIADLQGLYTRQTAVAEVFRTALDRRVWLDEPDFSQGVYTTAYPAFFNVLEENLRRLYRGFQPPEIEEARVWQGVELDKPRLSARDANRWFETLAILLKAIEAICERMLVAGTCRAGGDRTWQWIRVV